MTAFLTTIIVLLVALSLVSIAALIVFPIEGQPSSDDDEDASDHIATGR